MQTDPHNHILPKTDDGARTMQESLTMAKIAESEGIKNIICTPHSQRNYDLLIQSTAQTRAELQAELDNASIEITLHSGFEVYINSAFLDYEHIDKLTLANSQYILIETDFECVPRCMDEALYLIRIAKLVPVLAHPERYVYLKNNFKLCETWRNSGMMFQVNASSIQGVYGKTAQKLAKKLFKKGLVDFLGTDAHSADNRPPLVGAALVSIEKLIGKTELAKILLRNSGFIDNI